MKTPRIENYVAAARHLQIAALTNTPVKVTEFLQNYHISKRGMTPAFLQGLELNRPTEDIARAMIEVTQRAAVEERARRAARQAAQPAEAEPVLFTEAPAEQPAAAEPPAPTAAERCAAALERIAAALESLM